jgi:hypothetical protein
VRRKEPPMLTEKEVNLIKGLIKPTVFELKLIETLEKFIATVEHYAVKDIQQAALGNHELDSRALELLKSYKGKQDVPAANS